MGSHKNDEISGDGGKRPINDKFVVGYKTYKIQSLLIFNELKTSQFWYENCTSYTRTPKREVSMKYLIEPFDLDGGDGDLVTACHPQKYEPCPPVCMDCEPYI